MTTLRSLVPVCGGLAVSLAAALACVALHTPLPWMIGALPVVVATRVAGWPVGALPGGRQAAQWIIGTALGLYFSPLVAQRVSGFVWLLVLGTSGDVDPCDRSWRDRGDGRYRSNPRTRSADGDIVSRRAGDLLLTCTWPLSACYSCCPSYDSFWPALARQRVHNVSDSRIPYESPRSRLRANCFR